LIGDLGWAVGLRIDEIRQLNRNQFLSLHPDPAFPGAEQILIVVGKGGKRRSVAVPNWLVVDAISYVDNERAFSVNAGGRAGRQDRGNLLVTGEGSSRSGRPITHRRIQQVVEEACLRAGLTEVRRRTDPETRKSIEILKAKHCVHDLRHTYATLT
jgi:integrase